MRARQIAAAAGLIAGVVVLDTPQPAGASVTGSTSGTTMTIIMAGTESVSFECNDGFASYRVGSAGITPAPGVTCAALTAVNVGGDAGAQTVTATGLGASAFSAKPKLVALMGGGADVVTESPNADTIGMGAGVDTLVLRRGAAANPTLDMGADSDFDLAILSGTDGADQLAAASNNANIALTIGGSGSPTVTSTVQAASIARLEGGKGDDTINASGVLIPSTLSIDLLGGDGNDTITSAAEASTSAGGTGTNTFLLGSGADQILSESDTDTINGASDASPDYLFDGGLRFGGRTLNGFANTGSNPVDLYETRSEGNDVAVRVRPLPGDSSQVVMSLNRSGSLLLPGPIEELDVDLSGYSSLPTRVLGDVVMGAQDVQFTNTTGARELYDVQTPTAAVTTTTGEGMRIISSPEPNMGEVRIPQDAPVSIHPRWPNVNQSFAHRVHRDLVHRFPSDADRVALANQLANGTKTRAQVVAGIVNSDEYRGIDVDRVFFRYLRRSADPGGRTYWINSIKGGKSLRQFRAQLFGSGEYFTKAGGTNEKFVARAYEDVLGRKPDPSGLAYWTKKANSGTERGLIARQFLSSSEAKRSIVRDQYLRFSNRQPTASDITQWSSTLDSNANGEQLLVSFLTSNAAYASES